MDEVLKYFDATKWAELGLDAKHWLSQGAKSGIEVYAAAQDFSQVAKMFRILVTDCDNITKIIGSRRPMKTSPPVKYIWGVCTARPVNPATFKGDSVTMESSGFPWPFLIQKRDCEIFDTNASVSPTELPRFKHTVRYCEHYGKAGHNCEFHKVIHS